MLSRFLVAFSALTITIAPAQALAAQKIELLGNLELRGKLEAWYQIQACNKGPLMYDLDREVGEAVRAGWNPTNYPRDQWELEAEARNAAANYTEDEIDSIFSIYCH